MGSTINKTKHGRIHIFFLLFFVFASFLPTVHAAESSTSPVYISERDLPRNIAIPLPQYINPKDADPKISQLIRGVLKNYLTEKGFTVLVNDTIDTCTQQAKLVAEKDETISMASLQKSLAEAGVKSNGILLIVVHDLTGINVGFVQNYALDGEVRLFDDKAKLLGSWRDKSSRHKFAVATDPLSAVLTLVTSAVNAKGDVHRRDMVYDWAFNITQQIPGFSSGSRLPKILRVVSNVTEQTFKMGEQIVIGIEGDRGMKATFDIGQFRKEISLAETQPGIYQGSYVVREGDKARHEQILIHLAAADGNRRDWPEIDRLVSMDGIPPTPPTDLTAEANKKSILLQWVSTDPEVATFHILRSQEPMQGYTQVGSVSDFQWQDLEVAAGTTYYYRVLAVDQVGNPSAPVMSKPITLPQSGEPILGAEITGTLVAGRYRLLGETVVPAGRTLKIAPGVTILAGPSGQLIVKGSCEGDKVLLQLGDTESENREKTPAAAATTSPSADTTAPLTADATTSPSADTPAPPTADATTSPSADTPTPSAAAATTSPSADTTAPLTSAATTSPSADTTAPSAANSTTTPPAETTVPPATKQHWLGVKVAENGQLTLRNTLFRQCQTCIDVLGGRATIKQSIFQDGTIAIHVQTPFEVSVKGGKIDHMEQGVVLADGTLSLEEMNITSNKLGVKVSGGQLTLRQTNLYDNEQNLSTSVPLVLQGNYLGGMRLDQLRLEGQVTLRSLLDAPWPDGREQAINADKILAKADEEKKLGLEAFNNRQYGKAYEHLKTALAYKEDRETRLHLAYALNAMGETSELAELLQVAIERYPYEVRFFNLAVRHALAAEQPDKARALLERALRMNPGNAMLEQLQMMVGE